MPAQTPRQDAASRPSRRPLLGLGAVLLLHLALLWHFAPPEVIFSDEPLADIDFPLHYYQVDRALKAWNDQGKLWGYDPLQLAGHPIGALEDLSSKSLELFVIAGNRLGLHPARALNLYVLLVHLLLPFIGFLTARLFRLSRWQAVGVSLFWVLLWFFDSFLHWVWFCGMVSWGVSSYLIVLLVALLHRTLGPPGHLRLWPAVALLASLLALLHPYAALILIAPCAGLYLREIPLLHPARRRRIPERPDRGARNGAPPRRGARNGIRRLSWIHHVALGLSLCAALATALIYLLPALKLSHYLLEEPHFLHPGPLYLLWDYLDLMVDDMHTGPPVRTMLRVLAFAACAICLWRWRKAADRRLMPVFLLLAFGLLWAYFGRYIPGINMTQPYRHIGPAALAAAIPAVIVLSELLSFARIRAMGRPAQLLLVFALLLIVPRFVHNVLFYFPSVLPERPPPKPLEKPKPTALAGFVDHSPFPLLHHAPPAVAREVRAWLEQNLKPSDGRVAVQQFMLGEYLAASSSLPMLSGIEQRSIYHGDAYLFRLNEEGVLPGKQLLDYLERYAVKYVVVTQVLPKLEWRKDALVFRKLVGAIRIYETRIRPSYFMRGTGRVVHQELNRIVVEDAAGPEVVLRFHWLETLRCRPGCQIEQFDVKGDRVGFIRIKSPPRRFEIYNSYRFDGPRWRPPRQ